MGWLAEAIEKKALSSLGRWRPPSQGRTIARRSLDGEPSDHLVVGLVNQEIRLQHVSERGLQQRLVVHGPLRTGTVFEDDRPLAAVHVFLIFERPAISGLQAREADDHRLETHFLEPERDELGNEILSYPPSEVCRLLVGEAFHHPLDQGARERDEAELLRVD